MTITTIITAFSLAIIALVLIRISLTLADISAHLTVTNSSKERSLKTSVESVSAVQQAAQLPLDNTETDDTEIAAVIAIASSAFHRAV